MSLIADAASIAVDAPLLRSIVQGDANTTVVTSGGVVPSLARLLSQVGAGTIKGAWLTATAYALGDVVTQGGLTYRCLVAHTSGTFATDLAALKWVVHYTAGQTVGVKVQTPSSTPSGGASMNVPHGTAPTTPVDGDMWTTTAGVFVRVNGVTVGPLIAAATLTGEWWAKITNATAIAVTATTTLTANRVHYVTGTSANYDIPLPAAPAAGTVVGVIVGDWAVANKTFRLDAGAGVVVCGRTRYLTLVHTNTALLYFDGAKWLPLVLCLDTLWLDAGASTVTATTTNPTKGGGTTYDHVWWRRIGDSVELRYEYRQTTAGSAGSGTYLFAIPLGAIDVAKVEEDTSASSFEAMATAGVGFGYMAAGASGATLAVSVYDSTKLRLAAGTAGIVGSAVNTFANATYRYHFLAHLPMTDW